MDPDRGPLCCDSLESWRPPQHMCPRFLFIQAISGSGILSLGSVVEGIALAVRLHRPRLSALKLISS